MRYGRRTGARRQDGTLERPRCRPVAWDQTMLEVIDLCVLSNANVQATARTIGVDNATLARGALLRLRQILLSQGGPE